MKSMKLHTWKTAVAKMLMALMVMMSVAVITPAIANAASKPALNKTTYTLFEGKQYDLNIANKIKKSTYTWTTSNKKVAKVDKKGLVTAVSKGTATITCKVKAPKKNYTLTCKVTVIKPAKLIKINNKVSALTAGQVYDLNRTLIPSISNDKTYWTTSNASIASPDKNGKFTALKEGTVTITATTKSGAKDSVKIKVVDKDGTVSNQNDLNALLGSGASKITLKTNDAASFVIAAGDYTKQAFVVDAPNADVTNNGKFASIVIKAIKSNTWYENAVGNLLQMIAPNGRIVVAPTASVSIDVNEEGATLTIVNNGEVKKITVSKQAAVTIYGDSKESVPVSVDVPNVKITTSLPLNLVCNAKAELVVLPGAEKTAIQAATESVIPTLKGNVTIEVKVGTGDNTTTKTVIGTPINSNTGSNGGSTPTPSTTLTFDTAISNISAATYKNESGIPVIIDGNLLDKIKFLLTSDASSAVLAWNLSNGTYTVGGQEMTISNGSTVNTKTVSIKGGQFDGKSYSVSVNAGTNGETIVTIANSSATVTITKGANEKTFSLTTATTVSQVENSQTLAKLCNILDTITFAYNGKTYTVDVPELVTVKKYIDNAASKAATWNTYVNETKTVDGQTLTIKGTNGSAEKVVTFTSGQFAGKSFTVTLTANALVIKNNATNVTATVNKSTDTISVSLN